MLLFDLGGGCRPTRGNRHEGAVLILGAAVARLPVFSLQHGLDVDNRRAVDGLDRSDAQPGSVDRAYDDGMKAQRVGPVRRSRREDSGQRIPQFAPWVDLQDIAARPMEPRDHDDFVADNKAAQCLRRPPSHLEPGIGRALVLAWARHRAI
jgi:hypothetical protein